MKADRNCLGGWMVNSIKTCKECGKDIKECIMNVSLKEYKKQVNKDFFKVLDESKKHKKFKKDIKDFIKKTGG